MFKYCMFILCKK